MSDILTLTEEKMIDTFGRALANRVKLLTASTDAVFDEFDFKGRSYLGGYDYCRKNYYILPARVPAAMEYPQPRGTIITVRTKQDKKSQAKRLEAVHS